MTENPLNLEAGNLEPGDFAVTTARDLDVSKVTPLREKLSGDPFDFRETFNKFRRDPFIAAGGNFKTSGRAGLPQTNNLGLASLTGKKGLF